MIIFLRDQLEIERNKTIDPLKGDCLNVDDLPLNGANLLSRCPGSKVKCESTIGVTVEKTDRKEKIITTKCVNNRLEKIVLRQNRCDVFTTL